MFVIKFFFVFILSLFFTYSAYAQTYNVRDFGAVGDGKTRDTLAVRDALAAAANTSGGRVIFDAGYTFLTGCFNVTSNIILDVQGTILASTNSTLDFVKVLPLPWSGGSHMTWQAIVHSFNASNITITGGGIIDGQGLPWWSCIGKMDAPCLGAERPFLVRLVYTDNIRVYNITFQNSPAWTFHLAYTNNVHIYDFNIEITMCAADVNIDLCAPNTDGIDIECSVDVLVENYYYDAGDDAIAVKSGYDYNGRMFGRTTENVVVQNSRIGHSHGLTIGSEMSHGVRNVTFRNIIMNGSDWGIYLRTGRGRGGLVTDITYSNISIYNSTHDSIMFDMNFVKGLNQTNATATPVFQNINLNNIYVENSLRYAWHIDGLPESPYNNTIFYNITVVNSKMFIGNCDNIYGSCDNATVFPYCPPCIVETCFDTSNDCAQYLGACNNPSYKSLLCSLCRKTCNLCSSC